MVVRTAMSLGVKQAGFVRVLVRLQTMAMGNMRVMGGLFMVAVFVVIRGFAMMDRRFFVMLGGFAVMFRAFMSRRHEIVLRCDNDGNDRVDGDERGASFIGRSLILQGRSQRKHI
jgi:hypothetical protein